MQTQFQVKEYSRKRQIIFWVFLALLVVGLMVASYIAGFKALGFDSGDADDMQARVIGLNKQLVGFKKENKRLLDQAIKLKRDAEFNRAGEVSAKQALAEAQQELAEANQELIFFRSLLKPDEANQKLNIHSLVIESSESSQSYLLVLTKFRDSSKHKKGKVDVIFEFASGETIEQKKEYKFKFFQRIYGDVPTLEGEMPEQIVLKLYNNSGKFLFKKTYSWSNLVSGDA